MKNHKHIGAIAFWVLTIVRADAQQIHHAIASGGGEATGATGKVSYTIGQTFYTTTSDPSGTLAAGIQTTLNLNTPLPIELLSFSGKCANGKVHLGWETGVEINNDFFAVEKSADARAWTITATVKGGQESKDYSYVDEHPSTPVSYYRLKQVDLDGGWAYSPVIHVLSCAGNVKAVTLYPNPTATGVYLVAENIEGAEFELYDIKGTILRKGKMQNGTTYVDMSVWTSGTYFLRLTQNNSIINNFSIIKN